MSRARRPTATEWSQRPLAKSLIRWSRDWNSCLVVASMMRVRRASEPSRRRLADRISSNELGDAGQVERDWVATSIVGIMRLSFSMSSTNRMSTRSSFGAASADGSCKGMTLLILAFSSSGLKGFKM